jgi:hypothetical protein
MRVRGVTLTWRTFVDATPTREAVFTDEDSRWRVIETVARDLTEGAKKLARNSSHLTPTSIAFRRRRPCTSAFRWANH